MRETTTSASIDQYTDQPSVTIVTLIADLEGVGPTELAPPLYSAVDPEALDSVFRPPDADGSQTRGSLTFRYCGYEIVVESGGDVSITSVDDDY